MNEEIVAFGDIEIDKRKFICQKNPILIEDVDIDKILISNNVSCVKENYKFFISYRSYDYEIKSLSIILPETTAYVRSYDDGTSS